MTRTIRQSMTLTTLALAMSGVAAARESAREPFSLLTDDGATLAIQGLIQFDSRSFLDGLSADEFLIRRARLTLDGRIGSRTSFRIRPESGARDFRIIDAYFDTRLSPGTSLRAGRFKPPVGLERLQSAADLRLVERSFVTELLPARDLGIQVHGRSPSLEWAIGLFNGVPDGRADQVVEDGAAEIAARLFLKPVDRSETGGALLGFGLGMTFGSSDDDSGQPVFVGYRSPGQETIFGYRTGTDGSFAHGDKWRLSPQFYWYRGAFGVMGEWARSSQAVSRPSAGRADTLEHDAWQLSAEWFVTGEAAGYADPGTANAVQLVARISGLDPDGAAFDGGTGSFADVTSSVRGARSAAFGINWFPVRGLKASFVYEQTVFAGGAAAGNRPSEKLLLMRLQQEF